MNPRLFAFKIIRFLHPPYFYKELEVDASIPLASQTLCPADDNKLKIICTLFNEDGSKKIRIGCCASCGYVGYIDRPSREWIKNYYLETWDEAETKNIEKEAEEYRSRSGIGVAKLGTLAEKFVFDKQKHALEIGCGYGRTLRGLKDIGFEKLVGIEHSPHRAEVARRAYGAKVFVSPFEAAETQAELKKLAPFGLIYSSHVLEHTYHPSEIMGLCAGLQRAGDYLILALPNVIGETSGGVLLYFPHLHGFTPWSLENMLAKNGYKIAQSLTGRMSNYVIARKEISAPQIPNHGQDHFEETLKKFTSSLSFGKHYKNPMRVLWWFRNLDFGGQAPVWPGGLVRSQWLFMSKFYHARKYRDLLVERFGAEKYKAGMMGAFVADVSARFTSYEESPLEIQFKDNIKLLYK